MSHSHYRAECKHGVVTGQCRCASKDKSVTIVDCPESCDMRSVGFDSSLIPDVSDTPATPVAPTALTDEEATAYTERVEGWMDRLRANPDSAYLLKMLHEQAQWIAEDAAKMAREGDTGARDATMSARWHIVCAGLGQIASKISDKIGLPPVATPVAETEDDWRTLYGALELLNTYRVRLGIMDPERTLEECRLALSRLRTLTESSETETGYCMSCYDRGLISGDCPSCGRSPTTEEDR